MTDEKILETLTKTTQSLNDVVEQQIELLTAIRKSIEDYVNSMAKTYEEWEHGHVEN